MSIVVNHLITSISCIEQRLAWLSGQFGSHNQQVIDKCFLEKTFSVSSSKEAREVSRYIFRILLDSLIGKIPSLCSFFPSGYNSLQLKSGQKRPNISPAFCAFFIRETVEVCLADKASFYTELFYDIVQILGEKIEAVPPKDIPQFLERLFENEISFGNSIQFIVALLVTSNFSSAKDTIAAVFEFLRVLHNKSSDNWERIVESFDIAHKIFVTAASSKASLIIGIKRSELIAFLKSIIKVYSTKKELLPDTFAPFETFSSESEENSDKSDQSWEESFLEYVDLEEIDFEDIINDMSSQNKDLFSLQIKEIGVSFTASVDICKQHLNKLNLVGNNLNSVVVSRIIVMMTRTCSVSSMQTTPNYDSRFVQSSDSTASSDLFAMQGISWNPKVFAITVKELSPTLSWSEVVMHFDDNDLYVNDKKQLQFLTSVLFEGFGLLPFPVGLIYREWNSHKDGQLSWIEQIVQNPDVFCFADFSYRPVNLSVLKSQTEEQKNEDHSMWRSLDLLEILLRLSETKKLAPRIVNLFHKPLSSIPDIIFIGLTQLSPQICGIRNHLYTVIIPILISHQSAVPTLNLAWSHEELNKPPFQLRSLILSSLCTFYSQNTEDQTRLTRILELAHELKPNCLSELFNLSQFSFVIDLACLASRRDFLKLDKWLEDKLAENGDQFATALTTFIHRRLSGFFINNSSNSLSPDLLQILLSSLTKANNLSPQVVNEVQQLVYQTRRVPSKNCDRIVLAANSRTQIPGSASTANMAVFGSAMSTATSGLQQNSNFHLNPTTFGNSNRDQFVAQLHSRQQQHQQVGNIQLQMFSSAAPPNGTSPNSVGNYPQPSEMKADFAANQALSVSPTQMMRTTYIGGPVTNRSAAATAPIGATWNMSNITSGVRTGNAGMPNSSVDLRSLPPSGPNIGFVGNAHSQKAAVMPNSSQMNQPATETFAEDIQTEANLYFQQIYSQSNQISVSDFISRLKAFKNSTSDNDKKVLECVIKNLFEEYRFFHEYPERELITTAEVYGSIIREGIISNIQFATAIRKVVEALQSHPDSLLFTFGSVSLGACRNRLHIYPKVCLMIKNLDNFKYLSQNLKEFVTAGTNGVLPTGYAIVENTNLSGPGSTKPSSPAIDRSPRNSMLSVANVDTLVTATEKEGSLVKQPPTDIQEKVAFLFNNLSQKNMPSKMEEIKQLMIDNGEVFVRWLAQYVVMKRVTIEQNFQPLYNNFLLSIGDKNLDQFVKEETYRNIKILLRSDKRQCATGFGDRQLLKHLGYWLGAITIARDRPILIVDLDLKALLLEAFYKGQEELLFVVPFIAKILASCCKSSIFNASCAWIRAILNVMAELHNQPDLKLNLKFEIEVLCKELGVNLESIGNTSILKSELMINDCNEELLHPVKENDLKDKSDVCALPEKPIELSKINQAIHLVQKGQFQSVDAEQEADLFPRVLNTSESPVPVQAPATYCYRDISIVSYDGLVPLITLRGTIPLFKINPQLKHLVKSAIIHAVKDVESPIAEKAAKISLGLTEYLCRKDFVFDSDEKNMRRAAHHCIRATTAAITSAISREMLHVTMRHYLRQTFMNSLRGVPEKPLLQMQQIDEAVLAVILDNIEVTESFCIKTACEKAVNEIDARLKDEYASRAQSKRIGRSFSDPLFAAKMQELPEKIRPVANTTDQMMSIYTDFTKVICGFKPSTAEDLILDYRAFENPAAPSYFQSLIHSVNSSEKDFEQITNSLRRLVDALETSVSHERLKSAIHCRAANAIISIRDGAKQLAMNPRDVIQLQSFIQWILEQFCSAYRPNDTSKSADAPWSFYLHSAFIMCIRILSGYINTIDLAKMFTRIICDCQASYKYNVDALLVLIQNGLLLFSSYDPFIVSIMENEGSLEVVQFAQRLVKGIQDMPTLNAQKVFESMPLLMEHLAKLQQFGQQRPTPDSFHHGVDSSQSDNPSIAANFRSPGMIQADTMQLNDRSLVIIPPYVSAGLGSLVPNNKPSGLEEPPSELQSKVEQILREWIRMCYTTLAQRDPQQALSQIVAIMHEHGVLANDDIITRFFRLCTEMCVDVSYRLLKGDITPAIRQRCYYTLDAFVKLVCLMVRYSDGSPHQVKLNLLKKVLNILTNVLSTDHSVRGIEFQSMPYHRIIISMFNSLTQQDALLNSLSASILEAFGQALFLLQPRRVPSFAFSWLDIVGHRNFIAKLLRESTDIHKTTAMYTQLLISHIKFVAPYLRNIHMPKSIATLYKGTLRLMLVILHDFPEILCDYHLALCDVIPHNCVQLRNLVLSAYPKNMRLPDPFCSDLRVETLPDMALDPKLSLVVGTIIPGPLKASIDEYLKTRLSVRLHGVLPSMLQVQQPNTTSKYSSTLINALVLYVGMRAIEALRQSDQSISVATVAHSSYMDILQSLAATLCTEGRYLFFNAIANQLRYPNSHTHYFSCALLYLFKEAYSEVIKEQITRILFERLVALRPHPWGLLITFIELMRNEEYNFWNHVFVRCAPEIDKLFKSVAHSCIGPSRSTNSNSGPAVQSANDPLQVSNNDFLVSN